MAKTIMIQGTTSGAGKSLLTAGLCRVLRQDGYKVAPFKSQNMALNSFITREGLEMGRAQVLQAEAAGVEPSILMNPVLLKPTGDMGSQVIVKGEVVGTMDAQAYFAYRSSLIPIIEECLETLKQEYDIVVIEGAGSPAEINLREPDIVNMGVAKMANAPVLIVSDIDRGGVFASLYGTVALLKEEERAHVKGTVINKFRGDLEILRPGLAMLEELTGVPVLGTVPYLYIDLEDEDSLAPRLENGQAPGVLDIAVVRLPRISNFTDFYALEQVGGVSVRYVESAEKLGSPDLLILPGTKNTMDDLRWMRQNGLEALIKKLAANGTPVIGICGGYQMLGEHLSDPHGVEAGGEMAGMGLLPMRTVFEPAKTRTRVQGKVQPLPGLFAPLSGKPLEGYEIHMGISTGSADTFSIITGGMEEADGAVHRNVLGSYVHGLFDSRELTDALLSLLLARKGLSGVALEAVDLASYKEEQLDKLADALRCALDMNALMDIIEQGI